MPNKHKTRKANRRNAFKLSGRNGGDTTENRIENSVVRRVFQSSANLAFIDTSGDVVSVQSFGGLLSGFNDYTMLSELYQQFRLLAFECKVMPSTTQDQVGYDGVIVADPDGTFNTGLNVLNYMQMRGAFLWSNQMRSRTGWTTFHYRPPLTRTAFSTAAVVAPGNWLDTSDPTKMTGKLIFAAETSQSIPSTSGEIAARLLWRVSVEFRNPITEDLTTEVKMESFTPAARTSRRGTYLGPRGRLLPQVETKEGFVEVKEEKEKPPSRAVTPRR